MRIVGVCCWFVLAACGEEDARDRVDVVLADGGAVNIPDSGGRASVEGGADAGGALEAACSSLSVQQVATCAELDGNTTVGGSSFDVTGTVEEVLAGSFSCLGAWGESNGVRGALAWRFRVGEGTDSYWVGLSLPPGLVAIGDQVRVEYSFGLYPEYSEAHLVVRHLDGPLLIWIAKGNLMPPLEVEVASAGQPCSFEDDCGTVERDGLRVAIEGEEAVVGYGESAALGGYAVWHGGNDHRTQTTCPGVSGATTIAVFADMAAGDDAGVR